MARQHCTPLLLTNNPQAAIPLKHLSQQADAGTVSEADIQALVHAHPACLPIAEIDPMFNGAIAICRELTTPAGRIDNFLITPGGLPVIVECKLWSNAGARREVIGQILDYAKELCRLSAADVQRDVKACLGGTGNPLLDLVRAAAPQLDEIHFNDALTMHLRQGRFLLLIVGDGIRENVESIANYLQAHAGLHFSLGLVELPIYVLPNGERLVVPRVLAKTVNIVRTVIGLPTGQAVEESSDVAAIADADAESTVDPSTLAGQINQQAFWTEFLSVLRLDDSEQPRPKAARRGNIWFSLPQGPDGSAWLTAYRSTADNSVGVFLSCTAGGAGLYAARAIVEAWPEIEVQIAGTARVVDRQGRPSIVDSKRFTTLDEPEGRKVAILWLAERVNNFVNVIRPRVRSAMADYRLIGADVL